MAKGTCGICDDEGVEVRFFEGEATCRGCADETRLDWDAGAKSDDEDEVVEEVVDDGDDDLVLDEDGDVEEES